MTEVLEVRANGPVHEIVLNRPERRNAINAELTAAFAVALRTFDADDTARVAILTGADPAFCAGMDLKDLSWGDRERNDRSDAFAEVLRNIGKPVIAAVNGAAITGGLELALGCDFIIASERAFFGDTHVRVGVFPGGGMTVHLAEVIGVRRARQMSYTGELVDAREALRIGLVNEVLDHDQLLPRARELAAATAAADPALLNDLRAAYHRQGNLGIDAALDAEVDESRRRAVPTSEIAERRDSIIERGRSQVLH